MEISSHHKIMCIMILSTQGNIDISIFKYSTCKSFLRNNAVTTGSNTWMLTSETMIFRVPNKDEIIEVLGKLTADYTASAAASTATTSQTARLARLRDSSNFNINTSSTHANSMRTPSRVSGAHASRKSRVCHGVVGNNENVENAAVSSLRSGVEGGWGSHEGREKAGAGNRVAGGGELSTKTTFDAVLKSRFGVGVWGENKD